MLTGLLCLTDVALFIERIYCDWCRQFHCVDLWWLTDVALFIEQIYFDWFHQFHCVDLLWLTDVALFIVLIYCDGCWLFCCGDLWLMLAVSLWWFILIEQCCPVHCIIMPGIMINQCCCVDWSWLTNTALFIALICVDLSWLTSAALFIALINCNWALLCYWFTVWWWTLRQPTQWGLTWRPSRRMRTVSSPATVSVTTGTRRGGHRVVSVVQCQKWEGTVLFELRSECLKTSGLEVCFISI